MFLKSQNWNLAEVFQSCFKFGFVKILKSQGVTKDVWTGWHWRRSKYISQLNFCFFYLVSEWAWTFYFVINMNFELWMNLNNIELLLITLLSLEFSHGFDYVFYVYDLCVFNNLDLINLIKFFNYFINGITWIQDISYRTSI